MVRKANIKQNRNGNAGRTGFNNSVPAMAVVTRKFDQLIPNTFVTTVASTVDESQLGVGSRFVSVGLDYSIRNFLDGSNGTYTTFDQYRFEEIEVFALLDAPVVTGEPTLVVSSIDYDDAIPQLWNKMSQRDNTKGVVLSRYTPMKSIGRWKPRGNFITSGTDSPNNMVPPPTAWWDMANPTQVFNGVKVLVSSQQQQSIRFVAKARISFRGKI